ncbi:MAG: hypothetical protein E7C19_25560, partial [Klebsiella oxytoca]|nr:hypothetical protein [Klebsiella oxytoca]MDU2887812.1 hypothetical protein [Klebsiella oxytoca]
PTHRRLLLGSPDRCAASPPGILPHCALLPGAALNAPCPGYRFTAVCKPVTPTIHHRLRTGSPHDSSPPAGLVARIRRFAPQSGV